MSTINGQSGRKVGVGLYGANGHQIQRALIDHPRATAVAVAAVPEKDLPPELRDVRRCPTLDALLADARVELVSLCSPLRSEQGRDAVRCLRAGKHVYAEKPAALTEGELDEIIAAARGTGRRFHEQAGTAFEQPYLALRRIVESGALGTVVQVYCQKSYPWHDNRPQDERADGGLATQAGVYCTRFVEHVAGVPIRSLALRETRLGNPVADGGCRRAVSMLMELDNGGLASAVANYLCPPPPDWGRWGYETLRIWGTAGFVESIDGGRVGTLALVGRPARPLDFSEPGQDYLDLFLQEIQTGQDLIPFPLQKELSPTRWVVRAKNQGA